MVWCTAASGLAKVYETMDGRTAGSPLFTGRPDHFYPGLRPRLSGMDLTVAVWFIWRAQCIRIFKARWCHLLRQCKLFGKSSYRIEQWGMDS